MASNAFEHNVIQTLDQMQQGQEYALRRMRDEQKASSDAIIGLMKQCLGVNNDNDDDEGVTPKKAKSLAAVGAKLKSAKRITMSGLLNVIDGAASVEGRLLIMTTNHPESLDEALTRPGRCDHHFRIGYATKASAEQTFIRIFSTDPRRLHKQSTIIRFAQAFRDQFPINSKISTAKLAFYCGMYYNRPVDAVNDVFEVA
jgi:SpoVK/Ycf46/Vps4 family AAA+-type ATPase